MLSYLFQNMYVDWITEAYSSPSAFYCYFILYTNSLFTCSYICYLRFFFRFLQTKSFCITNNSIKFYIKCWWVSFLTIYNLKLFVLNFLFQFFREHNKRSQKRPHQFSVIIMKLLLYKYDFWNHTYVRFCEDVQVCKKFIIKKYQLLSFYFSPEIIKYRNIKPFKNMDRQTNKDTGKTSVKNICMIYTHTPDFLLLEHFLSQLFGIHRHILCMIVCRRSIFSAFTPASE